MAGPLKRYDVVIDGNRTTVKLTEEEAERRGLTKKRTAQNKAVAPADVATKAEEPAEPAEVGYVCADCGFEAKSAGGLAAHQRSHED